jgi:hypothetical protein
MKRPARVFLSTLAIAFFPVVPAAFAQSVSGGFHVVTDEGNRNIEFNAKVNPNGSASGDLKFSGPLSVSSQDVDGDGTGDPNATAATLSLRVDIDCVKVQDNRAAIAGSVKESSIAAYIGRRILLTVEDGGEGANAEPDRYTWGQYRSTAATWVASDAELEFDPGVGLSWIATDAERTDDAGVSSNHSASVDCKSFPLGSYSLESLPKGSGNIQVKP